MDLLTFLGHSTVLVDLDGTRVMTDPVFGHVAAGTVRRRSPAPDPESLADVSAVFISHGHLDHLDIASLGALEGAPMIVVPAGLGGVVAKVARGPIHELRAGDRIDVGRLSLEAVHAEHGRRRSLRTSAEGALGILITGSTRVYFAGDTNLFPGMSQLAGRVDVALLPVGGWGPRLAPGHLDPERAAEAVVRVAPRVAIPIHWGTLHAVGLRRATAQHLERAGDAFRDAVAARDVDVEVCVLAPGGSMPLRAREERVAG